MNIPHLAALTALAIGISSNASAAVMFDPDGSGQLSAISLGTVDWGSTGVLARNVNTAISSFISSQGACAGTSCQFDLYAHARVAGFLDVNGVPLLTPGLNTSYEITMIAGFTQVVTAFTTAGNLPIVAFETVADVPAFVQVFFDDSRDAADLSGSGFNDGRLILSGSHVGNANGIVSVTNTAPQALDQSPDGNQYTGQSTVSAAGSFSTLAVGSLTADGSFFITPLATFGFTFRNFVLGLPYMSVNPSDCFTGDAQPVTVGSTAASDVGCDGDHLVGLMASQSASAPGIVPVIGDVNALSPLLSKSPDAMLFADFNSSVSAAIPEPPTLALLIFAVAGLLTAMPAGRLLVRHHG